MPLRSRPLASAAKFSSEHWPEFQNPSSHRLVGDIEPALGEQIFNVAITEGEAKIKPDSVLDDRRRKLVARKRDRCHPPFYRPNQSAPCSRDGAPVPTADDAGAYARASEGLPSAPARTRRRSNCSGLLLVHENPRAVDSQRGGRRTRSEGGKARWDELDGAPIVPARPRRESRTPAPCSNERGGRRGFVTGSQKRAPARTRRRPDCSCPLALVAPLSADLEAKFS
jgi:hypothetical protein